MFDDSKVDAIAASIFFSVQWGLKSALLVP